MFPSGSGSIQSRSASIASSLAFFLGIQHFLVSHLTRVEFLPSRYQRLSYVGSLYAQKETHTHLGANSSIALSDEDQCHIRWLARTVTARLLTLLLPISL